MKNVPFLYRRPKTMCIMPPLYWISGMGIFPILARSGIIQAAFKFGLLSVLAPAPMPRSDASASCKAGLTLSGTAPVISFACSSETILYGLKFFMYPERISMA